MRQRILDPLGMHMTSTVVAGEMRDWNTKGHDDDGEVAPYRNWPQLPAMGALRSNAEDILRFLKANVGEPVTRLDSVIRMAHQVRNRSLLLDIGALESRHQLRYRPRLAGALTADLQGQVRKMARVGAEGPPPAVGAGNAALDLPLAAGRQAMYAGTYTRREGERTMELRIFVENGQLSGAAVRPGPETVALPGQP